MLQNASFEGVALTAPPELQPYPGSPPQTLGGEERGDFPLMVATDDVALTDGKGQQQASGATSATVAATAEEEEASPFADDKDARDEAEREAIITKSKNYARIGYFSLYAGMAASTPFYSLLLSDRGVPASAVGLVMALQPLSTVCVLSPMAYVADRYHCAASIMRASAVVSTSALLVVTLCSASTARAVTVGFMLLHFITRCVLSPFYDQQSMSILPKARKSEWGALRSFGGIGWGLCAPVASFIVDRTGWWVSAVALGTGLAIALTMYAHMVPAVRPKSTEKKFQEVLLYAVRHFRIILFLSAQCVMGMGYSLVGTFLFIFLTSLGAPKVLLGLAVTTTVVVEVPVFRLSKHIHARLTDRQLLTLSMLSWTLRATGYSFLTQPWYVLLLEPLHGLVFGLLWLSGIHFVAAAFPPSLSQSANGFLSTFTFGLGPIVGNICGGYAYAQLGPRWVFRAMGVFMFVCAVLFFTTDRYLEAKGYSILAKEEEEGEGDADNDAPTTRSTNSKASDVVVVDDPCKSEGHSGLPMGREDVRYRAGADDERLEATP